MACWKRSSEDNPWYPVIDAALYTECGKCMQRCPHGVFDAAQAPRPAVIRPGSCVRGCTECADVCPRTAIKLMDGDEEAGGCDFCGGCF